MGVVAAPVSSSWPNWFQEVFLLLPHLGLRAVHQTWLTWPSQSIADDWRGLQTSDMGQHLQFLLGWGIYCSKLLLERKPYFSRPTKFVSPSAHTLVLLLHTHTLVLPCWETKRHLETLSLPSTLALGDSKLTFRRWRSLTNYGREREREPDQPLKEPKHMAQVLKRPKVKII